MIGQAIGLAILIAAALWLVATGLMMAFDPGRALAMLRRTASSHRVNLTEQGLRLLAGVGAVLRAPAAFAPQAFEVAGWFVILSSLALIAVPLRWHAGYANWWADRMSHAVLRLVAPVSLAAGGGLIAAAL